MKKHLISRREALRLGAKLLTATALGSAFSACQLVARNTRRQEPAFDVRDYGAVGDGVTLDTAATLDRRTKYKGGLWDNRPTMAYPGIEPHGNPGFSIRRADNVVLKPCRVAWGKNRPDYFTHALEAEDVTGLEHPGFVGEAAHPQRDKAVYCVSV